MSLPVIVMGAAGRMGSTIARLVSEAPDLELAAVLERPGHEQALAAYPCRQSVDLAALLPELPGAVLVEFTAPEPSLEHARLAAQRGNPMVIGTTGFSDGQKAELERLAAQSPLFLSPNMSVGVNVLLDILPELTRLLGDAYDVEMSEIHHNRKKDAPSGTALRLAEALAEAKGWNLKDTARCCREGIIGERPREEIGIQTLRGGDVVGVHTVYYMGPGERIEVTHHAHSRENFANGALRAVRWMHGKKPGPLYTMKDVLRG